MVLMHSIRLLSFSDGEVIAKHKKKELTKKECRRRFWKTSLVGAVSAIAATALACAVAALRAQS